MAAITAVGIDFGTTNSVIALATDDGRVESRVFASKDGPTATFRTALTFWREGREVAHVAGPDAIARAAKPVGDQRFIQSLKTHLASRAFTETRLYGKRFSIEALVSTFLRDLTEGQDLAGPLPVTAGRPVVFAGANADEALAVSRLTSAFTDAGMPGVAFAYEPLGAAYWYARDLRRDETVLVADFGGGTSDFSVLRFIRGDGRLKAVPLAHSGVGIAGDTFDYRIVDHVVAPRLGKGATYRSFDKDLPIPAYIHASFSQWHQLSWLKSGTILADLRKLAEASSRGDELEALITIVEMDMGFALYRAIGGPQGDAVARNAGKPAFHRLRRRHRGRGHPRRLRGLDRRGSGQDRHGGGRGAGAGRSRRGRDRRGLHHRRHLVCAGRAPSLRAPLPRRPHPPGRRVPIRRLGAGAAGGGSRPYFKLTTMKNAAARNATTRMSLA